jgi:hypothetical protein
MVTSLACGRATAKIVARGAQLEAFGQRELLHAGLPQMIGTVALRKPKFTAAGACLLLPGRDVGL